MLKVVWGIAGSLRSSCLQYEQFLVMQNKLEAALKTVDLLTKRKDTQAVIETDYDGCPDHAVVLIGALLVWQGKRKN